MKFEEEYPRLNKFLKEYVYSDITEDFHLVYITNRYEEDEIGIVFNDRLEKTPISEINGWVLPVEEPFVLGLFNPYDAEAQLKRLGLCN